MDTPNDKPALRPASAHMPGPQEWAMLKEQAQLAVRSKLLPAGISTPEQAVIIALKGREIGVPPMQAFSHIHVIKGKPAISAELMLALIYKNCPGSVISYLQTDAHACRIQAKRPGNEKPSEFSFTIEEAKMAGLTSKDSWRQYPAAMLRARCISLMARAIFPDAIMGCSYVPEELGAEVTDEGVVVVLPEEEKELPKTKLAQKIDDVEQAFKNPPPPQPVSRMKDGIQAYDEAIIREMGITSEMAANFRKNWGKRDKGKAIAEIPREHLIEEVEWHDKEITRGAKIGDFFRDYILHVKAFLMKADPNDPNDPVNQIPF
jgi:hypothetical protein